MNNEELLEWLVLYLGGKMKNKPSASDFIKNYKLLKKELAIFAIVKQFIFDLPAESFEELQKMVVDCGYFEKPEDFEKWVNLD